MFVESATEMPLKCQKDSGIFMDRGPEGEVGDS